MSELLLGSGCMLRDVRSRTRTVLRWLLTVFMVVAGANHFVAPAAYVAMMPSVLPAPAALSTSRRVPSP